MNEIKKQFELSMGDKVVLMDETTLQYTTMFYQGMHNDHQGAWKMSGYPFKGNLYGTFHYNKSQHYWFYKPEEEE